MERKIRKVIVGVFVLFDKDGRMFPLKIQWDDGREFEIDRIVDVRKAASIPAGGRGLRYTCMIQGKETYLFYDAPIWFMEGTDSAPKKD